MRELKQTAHEKVVKRKTFSNISNIVEVVLLKLNGNQIVMNAKFLANVDPFSIAFQPAAYQRNIKRKTRKKNKLETCLLEIARATL